MSLKKPDNIISSALNHSLNASTTSRRRKTLEDFEFINRSSKHGSTSELGKGGYSTVHLVKDRIKGKKYAMKIIKKQLLKDSQQMDQIKNEIRIQRKLDHPHTLKLRYYFEDDDCVYLVLPYCEQGNLFSYIRGQKDRNIQENEAFIFFFQTTLAIEYLHSKNIIHRDLKPENLLLDEQGNIQVSDYGWSVLLEEHEKRTTHCGTKEYMAPEIVQHGKYDQRVDVWSLGVLLYELTQGQAPFHGKKDIDINKNILDCNISSYKYDVSQEYKDLVSLILQPKPNKRPSFDQIFEHPFVSKYAKEFNIDVDKFRKKSKKKQRPSFQTSSVSHKELKQTNNILDELRSEKGQKESEAMNIKMTDTNGVTSNYDNNIDFSKYDDQDEDNEDDNFAAPSSQGIQLPDDLEESLVESKISPKDDKQIDLEKAKSQLSDIDSVFDELGLKNQELNFLDEVDSAMIGKKKRKRKRKYSSRSKSKNKKENNEQRISNFSSKSSNRKPKKEEEDSQLKSSKFKNSQKERPRFEKSSLLFEDKLEENQKKNSKNPYVDRKTPKYPVKLDIPNEGSNHQNIGSLKNRNESLSFRGSEKKQFQNLGSPIEDKPQNNNSFGIDSSFNKEDKKVPNEMLESTLLSKNLDQKVPDKKVNGYEDKSKRKPVYDDDDDSIDMDDALNDQGSDLFSSRFRDRQENSNIYSSSQFNSGFVNRAGVTDTPVKNNENTYINPIPEEGRYQENNLMKEEGLPKNISNNQAAKWLQSQVNPNQQVNKRLLTLDRADMSFLKKSQRYRQVDINQSYSDLLEKNRKMKQQLEALESKVNVPNKRGSQRRRTIGMGSEEPNYNSRMKKAGKNRKKTKKPEVYFCVNYPDFC